MSVTIRDVAKRLNLSVTTVSRALDGYADVAEETRRLVIRTAQEMNYIPNQAARQLRRKRSDAIGYVLPAERPRFSDPFFAELIAGFGDMATKFGLDLLVSTAPPGSELEKLAYQRWINGRKVDGLVLNHLRLFDWRVEYLSKAAFPYVTLERSFDEVEYPSVEVDGRRWFSVLIEHLVSLGHRRIAYIGASPQLKIQSDRFNGYEAGLRTTGLEFDPQLVIEGDLTPEGGFRAASRLFNLSKPPTAIACVDDMTAIGVLHAASEHGYLVGQDLAVTGFDGIVGFEHTQPPLTTINQPVYEIARRMVQLLHAQIEGQPIDPLHLQIHPVLEIRESTIGKTNDG